MKIYFQEQFEFDSNATKNIDLIVRTSDSTKPGKYELQLQLKSTQEELNEGFSEPENLTLTIFVKDDNYFYPIIVGFTILVLIILAAIILKKRKKKIK